MLAFWRRPDPQREVAGKLYAAAVQQARQPEFYRDHGVPDTYEGRFEMVVLGVFALTHRLQAEGADGHETSRRLLETFFAAIDDDMREIGISDMRVPKKVLGAAAAFYGRSKAYGEALQDGNPDAHPDALSAAIARNVFAADTHPGAAALAAYLRLAIAGLARTDGPPLLAGLVRFPEPAAAIAPAGRTA